MPSASVLIKNPNAAVRLLKAMANEHRLNILCALRDGEMSVSQLCEKVASNLLLSDPALSNHTLSQSAMSQHLAWLRKEQLVACRRDAQSMRYSLSDARVTQVLSLLNELYTS